MRLGCWFGTPSYAAVLLVLAVDVLGLPATAPAQTTELDRLVGRDLWKDHLPPAQQKSLDKILGKVPKGSFTEPRPWHVWKTNRDGQTRYIVLLGETVFVFPGGSSACIQLFDAAAKRIHSWSFLTGWRLDLGSASIKSSTDVAGDTIVFQMKRYMGRNVAKEYFALSNDQLHFVRMENDKGEAIQNEYVYPNFEIGIVPDASTEDQWASILESKDKAVVLSALVFLGGRHLTEPERRFTDNTRASKYAGLFQQLLSSPRIRGLVQGLANSENEWIKQAAKLAARGSRERLFE